MLVPFYNENVGFECDSIFLFYMRLLIGFDLLRNRSKDGVLSVILLCLYQACT